MRCCAAALLAAQAARAASSAYFHPAGAPSPRPREETIPVVDIGPYIRWREAVGKYWPHDGAAPLPDECEKIVKQWGDAFRKCGFCQVLGHGVPDDVIAKARELGRDFFEATTDAERDACAGDGGRGYKGVGAVAVAASGVTADGASTIKRPPDYASEFVFLGDGDDAALPVPGLDDALHDYFRACRRANECFLELTARALGLEPSTFAGDFEGDSWLNRLRLAYYPSQAGKPPGTRQLRYGEHTDWQCFTIVAQDKQGLEVEVPCSAEAYAEASEDRRGSRENSMFVPCTPVPGALTVNAGDQIQILTNGIFRSCVHRVANPDPSDATARLSLVLFTGPRPDARLAPLAALGPPKWAPTTSGEHVKAKIAAAAAAE